MAAARGSGDLLSEIEAAALDPSSDLPALLRKCITLGSATGSERLREWAVRELKGYEADDALPAYRAVVAPLLLDGISGHAMVRDQAVPANMIPDFARDRINTEVPFPQPIAELADLLSSARSKGDTGIRLGVPGGPELVAIINSGLDPSRHVDRIFWSVSLSPIARILDVVRTTLVELVAEMRAGTPGGSQLPTREIAEQAVDIAINGNRNRVVVNQVGPGSNVAASAGGSASVGGEAETPAREVMWWIVGVAAVVTAVAAVWILFL